MLKSLPLALACLAGTLLMATPSRAAISDDGDRLIAVSLVALNINVCGLHPSLEAESRLVAERSILLARQVNLTKDEYDEAVIAITGHFNEHKGEVCSRMTNESVDKAIADVLDE